VASEFAGRLQERWQAKADETARRADAAMATEMLQAFGHPDVVAARYRPALVIIDPADGQGFLRWTVVGLLVIWSLGLVQVMQQPAGASGVLGQISHWWNGVVIPSLWWPGVLVVGYGLAAWARRRRAPAAWRPHDADRLQGGRVTKTLALAAVICGVLLLVYPHWILDFFWGGRAAPEVPTSTPCCVGGSRGVPGWLPGSPNRILGGQGGEFALPWPVPPGFAGFAGSIGVNVLSATAGRVWQNCLYVLDGNGRAVERWTQWDTLCEGSSGPGPPKA